jgi:hypothetical protein
MIVALAIEGIAITMFAPESIVIGGIKITSKIVGGSLVFAGFIIDSNNNKPENELKSTVYKVAVATIESTRIVMAQTMYNQDFDSFAGFNSTIKSWETFKNTFNSKISYVEYKERLDNRSKFPKLSEQSATDIYVTPRRAIYKYEMIDPSLRGATNK